MLDRLVRKKERKQTTQGRDGRTVHRHHTGISRRGQCGASRHLPLGACLFLSLFAVCRRFSLQPSCHPAVFLLSTFSLPSLLPLSLRSPLPRSAAPLLPVGPLPSRLVVPLGAVVLEKRKKERKQTTQGSSRIQFTVTSRILEGAVPPLRCLSAVKSHVCRHPRGRDRGRGRHYQGGDCVRLAELLPLCGRKHGGDCLLYTSPSPRDKRQSRMPSSA